MERINFEEDPKEEVLFKVLYKALKNHRKETYKGLLQKKKTFKKTSIDKGPPKFFSIKKMHFQGTLWKTKNFFGFLWE